MKSPSYERIARLIPGLLTVLLFLVIGPLRGLAQTEDDLTAAYLYNFGRSVEWPATAFANDDARFTIGIVGRAALTENFVQMTKGKNLAGREVSVRALSDPSEAAKCQIIFIADPRQVEPILAAVRGKPVLSVGEGLDFLKAGGMIAFSRHGPRLVFEASPEALESASLTANASILANRSAVSDIAIVVAKDSPLDGVTSEELGQIFREEKKVGPDGIKFVIFTRERTSIECQVVLERIYHMSEKAYDRFFMHALFSGGIAAAPRLVPTATAMKHIASSTPGALTYIFASQVDDTVKALKIDGFAPGDPQYPLKADSKQSG
jgi:YfiR/HmsC-like